MKKFTWETETWTACKAIMKLCFLILILKRKESISLTVVYPLPWIISTSTGSISFFMLDIAQEAERQVALWSGISDSLDSAPFIYTLFILEKTHFNWREKWHNTKFIYFIYKKGKNTQLFDSKYLIFDRKHRGRCLLGPPVSIQWCILRCTILNFFITLDGDVLNLPSICCRQHSLQ